MKDMKSPLDAETEPMTPEQTETYITCLTAEKTHGEDPIPEDFDGSQIHNIMAKRIKSSGADVSRWVIALLATLCNGRQGNAVLWAYACKQMHDKTRKKITMTELANFFPMGFPTEEAMHACWDSQKGYNMGLKNVDNYLDSREAWNDQDAEDNKEGAA